MSEPSPLAAAAPERPPLPLWRVLLRSVGVAGLVALLVMSLLGPSTPLPQGSAAPPTVGVTGDGGRFTLADWQGQVVVVNIWATWCPPCLAEMPAFGAAHRARHGSVQFVGLAVDSPAADIDRVVRRTGVGYPVAVIDDATQRAWNATALPSTYIVDAAGQVVWSVRGSVDRAILDAAIDAVIAAGNAASAVPAP